MTTTPTPNTPPSPLSGRIVAAQFDIDAAWLQFQAALFRRVDAEITAARARLHDAVDAKADRMAEQADAIMRGQV